MNWVAPETLRIDFNTDLSVMFVSYMSDSLEELDHPAVALRDGNLQSFSVAFSLTSIHSTANQLDRNLRLLQ